MVNYLIAMLRKNHPKEITNIERPQDQSTAIKKEQGGERRGARGSLCSDANLGALCE